jgi:hypothetical protein
LDTLIQTSRWKAPGFVKRAAEIESSLEAAIVSGRQILSARFQRGRYEFSRDHLRDSLAENGGFVDAVLRQFLDEGLIEQQADQVSQGIAANLLGLSSATYRILPQIREVRVQSHLGLVVDEGHSTIQRPNFCRHVVTLSPTQLKLVAAMCAGGEAGIVVSLATQLRGGEKTGERQFRTALNRSLSLLGVKLERLAWRLVEK